MILSGLLPRRSPVLLSDPTPTPTPQPTPVHRYQHQASRTKHQHRHQQQHTAYARLASPIQPSQNLETSQRPPMATRRCSVSTLNSSQFSRSEAKAFTRPPSSRLLVFTPPPLFMDPDTQLNLRTLHPEIHLSTVLNLMRCVQLGSFVSSHSSRTVSLDHRHHHTRHRNPQLTTTILFGSSLTHSHAHTHTHLLALSFSPPPSSYTRAHHTKASRHPVLHHGSWPHPRKGPIISLRDYSHAVVPKRVHGCTAYPYPVSQSFQAHSSSPYGIGMHQVVCTCLCAWCIRTS
ncbi:hypothetical protein CMEL01_07075 [Colletotrichum melonis]|uniref:Uncharacterized protein n=1 Tax=Colletotrichum melonis TaxID=1209925 RepID=A0AAI9U3A2_9PEZI|nr:hypothetical protein CMEL01_07075 [Colletotrichum melonis]